MSKQITIPEHYDKVLYIPGLPKDKSFEYCYINPVTKEECRCFEISPEDGKHRVKSSYFIGVDWIDEANNQSIYIEPKLNDTEQETNYLLMLFSALQHPEVRGHTHDLFEIKFDKTYIQIEQKQDKLTPLLVVQFLMVLKEIVRKGLKKSYYKVEQNLYSKVKGKVLADKTIKQNLVRNKKLNTYCSFDEFGFNSIENRLLKKTLLFVQRYLSSIKGLNTFTGASNKSYLVDTYNFITPAFASVSENVNLNEVKHVKFNAFYKEYSEAIYLSKLVLKRFGYHITRTEEKGIINTPPFWIDMSKLFELYVLGLLKEKCPGKVLYGKKEVKGHYGYPDFLLKEAGAEMIIDTKYKRIYQEGKFDPDNIRQISGYSRDKKILDKLDVDYKTIVDCLIIYPDQKKPVESLVDVELKEEEIDQFVQFYKLSVGLPRVC